MRRNTNAVVVVEKALFYVLTPKSPRGGLIDLLMVTKPPRGDGG